MYFVAPQACANDPVWASFTAHVHRVFLDMSTASPFYTLDKHKLSNKHANVCRLHLIGWMPFVGCLLHDFKPDQVAHLEIFH